MCKCKQGKTPVFGIEYCYNTTIGGECISQCKCGEEAGICANCNNGCKCGATDFGACKVCPSQCPYGVTELGLACESNVDIPDASTASQPQIIDKYKLKLLKITNKIPKLVKYEFKMTSDFTFNINDYNLRNFVDKTYFIFSNGTTNYLSGNVNNSLLVSPFISQLNNINTLTTTVSYQLFKILEKHNDKNYMNTVKKYSNKVMKFYINNLIPYIKKNISDNCCIKNVVKCLLETDVLGNYIYLNVYMNKNNSPVIYCHKQTIKILFVYKLILKQIAMSTIVDTNFDIQKEFYLMIWKTIIKYNKINVKTINETFYKLINGNLFDETYNIIFKKWFCFIDTKNQSFTVLCQIELATDKMTYDELLNATNKTYKSIINIYTNETYINTLLKLYTNKLSETNKSIGINNSIKKYNIFKTIDNCIAKCK
jgi:hypothetical protein